MTVGELAEILTELAETEAGTRVLVAIQPNYPLAVTLHGVAETLDNDGDAEPAIWLVASDNHPDGPDDSPYAPRGLWDAAIR